LKSDALQLHVSQTSSVEVRASFIATFSNKCDDWSFSTEPLKEKILSHKSHQWLSFQLMSTLKIRIKPQVKQIFISNNFTYQKPITCV